MADAIEIILSAVDSASDVFQSVISSAQSMADGITGSIEGASSDFDTITENVSSFSEIVSSVDTSTLEELANQLGMDTDEVERLISTGADIGSMSAGFNEAAAAADELEKEIQEDTEAMEEFGSAGDVMAAQTFMDMATGLKDSMLGMADAAGTYSDSMMRAGLEAEGAGISAEEMSNIVSELSDTTGRAGGQIRESFIKATARGVTDMNSFKTMMEGAGAQATLLGTDIQTMGDKFSGMAQKDTLMARTLAETGITMQELGTAMGMTGATADEVKAKWKELDTNQRAAILGQAASMNEGKTANQEYKTSWAGLQEQIEIAKGRLERIVGAVILPVLIPAMKLAGDILNGVGDVIQTVMNGPLGGLVSILGTAAGVFLMAVAGAAALRSMLAFLRLNTLLDAAATIFNTGTKILNGEASSGAAIANMLLGEGFMASAAAAWSAAAAFIAATWPLWVIVGAIVAVIAIIYELGKAFGWWTDVSSMIDAIKAGLMEMWDAFINHPDVQAVISALSTAWEILQGAISNVGQAIMEFFGVTTGGDFDILHALIDGIGMAWNAITTPIRFVISLVQAVIGVFNQFRTGQIDLPTFIMNVMMLLFTAYQTIFNQIMSFVISIGAKLVSAIKSAASRMVNGMISNLRALPGRVYSLLHGVVSRVSSAIQAWITAAKSKVATLISNITSPFSGVASAISSALSGVVSAIKAPFEAAYNAVKPILDKIKAGMDFINGITGAAGYDYLEGQNADGSWNINAAGYELSENTTQTINGEFTFIHDLRNLPNGVSAEEVAAIVEKSTTNDEFIKKLVNNTVFQKYDLKAKSTITARNNRARGV